MQLDPRATRALARTTVREALSSGRWDECSDLIRGLRELIAGHPLLGRASVDRFRESLIEPTKQRIAALEFYYAFGKLFPGVIAQAMILGDRLSQDLGTAAACAYRFLLLLNLQDELGYSDPAGPSEAHAMKQERLLAGLGLSGSARRGFRPSPQALAINRRFAASWDDASVLVPLLAVTEMLSHRYLGAASDALSARGVEETDYLDIHSVASNAASLDETHAEDLWHLAILVADLSRFHEARRCVLEYLEEVSAFIKNLEQVGA